MLEAVSWYVIYFLTHFFDCKIFSKLIKEKCRVNIKIILVCLIFALCDTLCGYYIKNLKMISINITAIIVLKIIYKKSFVKTLVGDLFITLGYAMSELLYAMLMYFVFFQFLNKELFEGISGLYISNGFIFIFYLLIFKINIIICFINNIIVWLDDNKVLRNVINFLLTVTICIVLLYPFYTNTVDNISMIIIFAILVGIIVFVIGYFKEKSTNNKLSIEYSEMLDYSKTYEKEVEEKSKNQHEYKNQLILLDSMIPKTNKKAKDYIKKLIDEENNINENDWMNKLKNLPNNGIKGFINFKIKKMIDNNIVVCVNIDKKLSTKKYWKNFEDNMEKISKVLGVYLDNAIEAASNSISKQIIIEFINTSDYIEFVLSNSYSGLLNYSEMDKQGYSTKGKGRGYGLSLAKDIIDKTDILTSQREINGKFYVQRLYIKK